MPANRFNGYTDLGIGIGLRVPHYRHILEKKPVVDWFEIISENFMVDGGRPLEVLDQILEQYQVVQHGVSMYFGSADRLDREHLQAAEDAGEADQDAVAFRSSLLGQRRRHATRTTCCRCPTRSRRRRRTAEKIREVRDFLEVPICVENVSSYAEFHASEMTEWEFLTEVVERADCGILLDVNNIYVSSQNHGFDPYDYLNGVPARPRGADARRRAQQVREVHPRHARSPGARPGVENVRPRHRSYAARRPRCWSGTTTSRRFDEVHDEALKAAEVPEEGPGRLEGREGERGKGARR